MSQNLKKFISAYTEADPYWEAADREYTRHLPGTAITRVLKDMDARYVGAFTALLQAQATITNPIIDRVARTGIFTNEVIVEKGDDTRAVTVVNNLYLWGTGTTFDGITDCVIELQAADHGVRGVTRTFYRRDYTTKEALIGANGAAVSNFDYTFPVAGQVWAAPTTNTLIPLNAICTITGTIYRCWKEYLYAGVSPASDTNPTTGHWVVVTTTASTLFTTQVRIVDHHDGSFDITQTAWEIEATPVAGDEGSYEREWYIAMVHTRTHDDKKKLIVHLAHEKACRSRKAARDYIVSQATDHTAPTNGPVTHTGESIVEGSERIWRQDKRIYFGYCQTLKTSSTSPAYVYVAGVWTGSSTGIGKWADTIA